MASPRILLIVGGGIAAYKSCELVRLIRKGGGSVTCVLTEGGSQFVTAMSLAALSENPVHTTLWDLRNEAEMGHIRLSREADLVVVCPATADLLARMAAGIADDLATTLMLATDKPVMAVPAMNVRMWEHAATRRNVQSLREAGVLVIDPDEGAMACGEFGPGRLPEPEAIWEQISALFTGPEALPMLGDLLPPPIAPAEFGPDSADDGEDDASDAGLDMGLGGLSASLISRSGTRRAPSLDDLGFDAAFLGEDLAPIPEEVPLPGMEALQLELPPLPPLPESLPQEPAPSPVGSLLLVKKGRAKAAPPTDPQAINHVVLPDRQVAPEPIAGDSHAVRVEGADAPDPLAGQPEFEAEPAHRPLFGKHILITAGPTHEPIDPVRYIANRSSGKQGFAIAAAAAALGARVTLVAGPVHLPTPPGVTRINVETARDMAEAVKRALPADCAVMVAAVADWRTMDVATEKMKKRGSAPPALRLTENPDILATVSVSDKRPRLVVGFAAETEKVIEHATEKRRRKGADWIVANDVSGNVMGGEVNAVHIVTGSGVESLPEMPKDQVAMALAERIADALAAK